MSLVLVVDVDVVEVGFERNWLCGDLGVVSFLLEGDGFFG